MEQRNPYWRLSGLSLVVFFVAVMILVGTLRWYVSRNQLANDLFSLGGIIGANSSAAVVFDDEKAAAEILASLGHHPAVIEATLFRKDGTQLTTYRAVQADEADTTIQSSSGEAVFSLLEVGVAVPVAFRDDIVGSVAIRASQRGLYLDLARFVGGFLAIGVFAFMLARFATGKLLRRTLRSENERREAEAARRETERRLHSVTDHLPVALFRLTAEAGATARFTYVSEGAAALLGIPPDRMLAASAAFFDAVGADDRAELERQIRGAGTVAPATTSVAWLGCVQRPDQPVWIEIRGSCSLDATGRTVINGVMQDVSQLRRYQDEVERSRERLQQLIAHREGVVDAVHRKIAVEIHDELGQIITAALLHVRLLDRTLPAADTAARDLAKNIESLLNDAYRSMKDIAVSLRPAVLNFGFVAAAEWLAERVLGVAGIAWRITTSEPPPKLGERQSIAFFRIVQESLTNCVRHAGADEVVISLALERDQLVLEIADNGRGLTVPADQEARFGLLGVRERAESLGGTASIASAPAGGTLVRIVVPAAA